MSHAVTLYQAFLGDRQRSFVAACAVPYDVSGNTGSATREYELFKAIHAARTPEDGPWGLVSWKFEHKAAIAPELFLDFARSCFAAGADCVFVNPMIGNEAVFLNVWEQWAVSRKDLMPMLSSVAALSAVPVTAAMDRSSFAFCNYFMATDRFWRAYFAFVDRVAGGLEAEAARGTAAGQLYAGSAQYHRNMELSSRPFVIERLFSTFLCTAHGLRIDSFPYPPEVYRWKFGTRLGDALRKVSGLKQQAFAAEATASQEAWNAERQLLLQHALQTIWQLDDPPELLLEPFHAGR